MTYRVAVIFLLLYLVRPQDWVPGMAGLNIIRPLMAIGLLSLLTRTPSLNRSELLRTPIDWLMVIYLAYLAYAAPSTLDAAKQLFPFLVFYFLATLALTDSSLLNRYLNWWLVCLSLIAVGGLVTNFGLDFTQAGDEIERMGGRLLVNTWLLNNPNALGHTVVIALPLAYLLVWWKRHPPAKLLAMILAIIAFQCAVYTESKGAFIAGAVLLVASFVFGRPLWLQVSAVVVALSIGVSGLMFLPRMSGMNNLRADEGVLGRVLAWEVARTAYQTYPTGVGWKQFRAEIEWEGQKWPKATHSSYVKVGADLGPIGLFLYLSLFCCGLRALFQYPGLDTTMERSRRAIFVLIVALGVSGWMIDRSYHTEFFLVLALAGAYMRLSLQARLPAAAPEKSSAATRDDAPDGDLQPAFAGSLSAAPGSPVGALSMAGAPLPPAVSMSVDDASPTIGSAPQSVTRDGPSTGAQEVPKKKLWMRYGILDCLLGYAALRTVDWLWDYILRSI